jgi:hypothetical protein
VATPTKQFFFICWSYGDLSASQSVLHPAAPTSIGPHLANWQHIRNGYPESQGLVWTEAATYAVSLNITSSLHKKPQGTASIGFFSPEPRLLLPSTIKRCPFFIAATWPVEESRTGSAPGKLPPRKLLGRHTWHTSASFQGQHKRSCDRHYSVVINIPVHITNATVSVMNATNASILLNYIPNAWKTVKVIMILKPGKNLSDMESYHPISLLLIMLKLFEKLILRCLKLITEETHLVPTHQFGIRKIT